MYIDKITWEQTSLLWKELWPDRDDVKHMSSMSISGTFEMEAYKKFEPTFFGLITFS